MRQGTAGGWAKVSTLKIIALSILNSIGITRWNHAKIIGFNKPSEMCDGTETLSYSFNLNSSYHPRIPYQKDIASIKNKFILFVGANDEANDPSQFPVVMQDPTSKSIRVTENARHFDIVNHRHIMEETARWIQGNFT